MCNNSCKIFKEWQDTIYNEGLEESPAPCIVCYRNYFED